MKDSKVVQYTAGYPNLKLLTSSLKYIDNNILSIKYNLSLLCTIIYQFERFRDKCKQNSTEIHTALGSDLFCLQLQKWEGMLNKSHNLAKIFGKKSEYFYLVKLDRPWVQTS